MSNNPTDGTNYQVLLVEDDPMIVKMYERKLVSEGFSVEPASNGEEGLAALKKKRPDIVLLDIMMPKMSGLDMLKVVKDDPTLKDVPIVILTNLGDREEDIKICKEMGAKDYWVKANMNLEELSEKIKSVIKG